MRLRKEAMFQRFEYESIRETTEGAEFYLANTGTEPWAAYVDGVYAEDGECRVLTNYQQGSHGITVLVGNSEIGPHMLEAGVPIMAIKNFLGHSSISTTERYAELSQGTVNRHIRDWNEKWFSHQKENPVTQKKEHQLPDFLK